MGVIGFLRVSSWGLIEREKLPRKIAVDLGTPAVGSRTGGAGRSRADLRSAAWRNGYHTRDLTPRREVNRTGFELDTRWQAQCVSPCHGRGVGRSHAGRLVDG